MGLSDFGIGRYRGIPVRKYIWDEIYDHPVGGNMDAYDIIGVTFAAGSIILVLMFLL